MDETSILSICEKHAHFLGCKFPITNDTRQRILNVFNSDFGLLAPTNLILLVLSYTCGNRNWQGPIKSNFNAYVGQAEGACSHNPYDDTYVFKMSYVSDQPFHIFNKLTSEQTSTFSSPWSCACADFDLEGNYYIAAYYENKICKYNKKHKLLWIKDDGGPISVAYRRTDRLLYTCAMADPIIRVLNPKDGSSIKTFNLKNQEHPSGQMHPMKFIPMEINGILEEILIIHEERHSGEVADESYGYCYLVGDNSLDFIKKFIFPFAGYGNFIYDCFNYKFLVSRCCTNEWFEYTFEM